MQNQFVKNVQCAQRAVIVGKQNKINAYPFWVCFYFTTENFKASSFFILFLVKYIHEI